MQNITILGSTGSIGRNTLDVMSRYPKDFRVFALTAFRNVETMLNQCLRFQPAFAVMVDENAAKDLKQKIKEYGLPTQVLSGTTPVVEVATATEVDDVMAAIVGVAGLPACMAAAHAGKRLLLANKEALVVGADLFMQAVDRGKATLLPVDSEHSAIFQCLPEQRDTWGNKVSRIILTASGGPFRTWDPQQLKTVSPEQALSHPTWKMGAKISIDSATMMNKALELIEAHYLFAIPPEQLEVIIHPESIIHSMVEMKDHSVLAQLGTTDMRVPITYGLYWPHRRSSGVQQLDFKKIKSLSFEPVNTHLFPCLELAWQVLGASHGESVVLNTANEVAVAAFLAGQIRFDQIYQVNDLCLQQLAFTQPTTLLEIIDLDTTTRRYAKNQIESLVV
jgi:1-deoxy-D-xylulose-5-phosphate reductoisomerase